MAEPQAKADLDLGEEKPGNKKLIIIAILVVVLLLGGGAAAYFLWFAGSGDEAQATEQKAAEQPAESAVEQGPAQYVDLAPPFVVNLPGRPSLLQVGISLRVTSDAMVEFLKHNDPMLRDRLLNLLQGRDAKGLKDRAAKEALQQQMLDEVNAVVKELAGPGQVDALYFTSFVMQ